MVLHAKKWSFSLTLKGLYISIFIHCSAYKWANSDFPVAYHNRHYLKYELSNLQNFKTFSLYSLTAYAHTLLGKSVSGIAMICYHLLSSY